MKKICRQKIFNNFFQDCLFLKIYWNTFWSTQEQNRRKNIYLFPNEKNVLKWTVWFWEGRVLLNLTVHEGLGPPHPPPGFHHQAPDASGLNPPSEMFIWVKDLQTPPQKEPTITFIEHTFQNILRHIFENHGKIWPIFIFFRPISMKKCLGTNQTILRIKNTFKKKKN